MSLATTVAKIQTVLEAVTGVTNVRARPGVPIDLEEARETWLTDADLLQRWTIFYATSVVLGAANANQHVELDVRVVAEWRYDETDDSYIDFADRLAAAQLALADPSTGFPQISEEGVLPVESPGEPVRIETGEGAYRASFAFHLINVTDT